MKTVTTSLDLNRRSIILCLILALALTFPSLAQMPDSANLLQPGKQPVNLKLDLTHKGAPVNPKFFGLMTEEINYSYDGGLYAELIQNRIFKNNAQNPDHWSLVSEVEGAGSMALDKSQPINHALTVCLKLENNGTGKRVGVANDGFWGIPVRPSTPYKASFYAKAATNLAGPVTITLESNDGDLIYAKAIIPQISNKWQKYSVTLTTPKDIKTSVANRLVISTTKAGTYWINLVSLFPPTYHNRANGNRPDLMQLLSEMNPHFLRFPGGNFLEGDSINLRFKWKETLGGLENRPGHPSCWRYRASDGMGLLEFLEWCEDLNMEPVLAVYAGYSLRQQHVEPGPLMQPYLDEALEEIEYVIGDVSTKWGAERAKNGHPKPFPLTYIEIGNEDFFDRSATYDGRFAQFYDAIKAKYPHLKLMATMPVKSRQPDLLDEHYYRNAMQMYDNAFQYDKYPRTGPKIFCGEWATREGEPTTNFNAALGDAAWMTGMERNADLVQIHCYAPLFVNVNPGGMQWKSDLIGYNALNCYGSPSYYAQKLFSRYIGTSVVPTEAKNIPSVTWQPPKRRGSTAEVPAKQVATFFYSVTRNAATGKLYLKLVNTAEVAQSVQIDLSGAKAVNPQGVAVVLTAAKTTDTNSITEPTKVVPVTSKVIGLARSFTRTLAPYSITVLQIDAN